MMVKQGPDGRFYVYKRVVALRSDGIGSIGKNHPITNILPTSFQKHSETPGIVIDILGFPKTFIGKKVRLVVEEVVEDKEDEK